MIEATRVNPAVFEPEETALLETALRTSLRRLERYDLPAQPGDVARLICELAHTRLRLNKPLSLDKHADEIADEVVEHISFLGDAPPDLLQSAREHEPAAPTWDRPINPFPQFFRQPPVRRL